MMKKWVTGVLAGIMVTGLVISPMNVKAATIVETEPNETKGEATEISVGDVYAGEIGSYSLYSERRTTDVDYLKINLEAGKSYSLKMTNYFMFYEDTSLLVRLIEPNGDDTSVGFRFVHDDANAVDVYSFTAIDSGYYYIELYNYFDLDQKKEHYYTISVVSNDSTEGGEVMQTPIESTSSGTSTVTEGVAIYRLYNSANGEHLYTTDTGERDV